MDRANSKHPKLIKDILLFTKKFNENPLPPIEDYKNLREVVDFVQKSQEGDEIADCEINDVNLPIGFENNLPIRIFRPKDSKDKILPIIFYFHGGGFVYGSKDSYNRFIRTIVKNTGCALIFPSYSLSPENKFPNALNECYQTLNYFYEYSSNYNLNKDKIAIVGDSSGANLAISTNIMDIENNGQNVSFMALINPITNLRLKGKSMKDFKYGPYLTKKDMKKYVISYISKKEDIHNKYVSPYYSNDDDLRRLPDTFIITSQNDPLRDDGELFASKLMNLGVNVLCVRYLGTIHSFMTINALKDTFIAKAAINQLCCLLKIKLQ